MRKATRPEEMDDESVSPAKKNITKDVRYNFDKAVAGPGGVESGDVRISSPFSNTWRGEVGDLNVGLANLRNGHFLYWGTPYQPGKGLQLSALPLKEIPIIEFYMLKEIMCWPEEVGDDQVPESFLESILERIIEGAWVTRGGRLVHEVDVEKYPAVVLDRLRGGFFRDHDDEVFTQVPRIWVRLKKTLASIERLGAIHCFKTKARHFTQYKHNTSPLVGFASRKVAQHGDTTNTNRQYPFVSHSHRTEEIYHAMSRLGLIVPLYIYCTYHR